MKGLIKTLLTEQLFEKSKPQVDLLNTFVAYACKHLQISTPVIKLQFNREGLTTTAAYGGDMVIVYVKDRAIVDIMRSIGHELVHMKQDSEGNLKDEDHAQNNAAGSPIENEANAKAGILIRAFGKLHPEIYH